MKIIDISTTISNKMTIWPRGFVPKFTKISDMEKGCLFNDTNIEMNLHVGTHVESQSHFIVDGQTINDVTIDKFIGDVYVAVLSQAVDINLNELLRLNIPKGTKRLLFKTKNSDLRRDGVTEFKRDYVGITKDAAYWLVEHNFELIGVDYLSVAKFEEAVEVHKILLGKNIILLEGINLTDVDSGVYYLICLPVKILGTEAAPTRAILIKS